jgi:hypothetical protein
MAPRWRPLDDDACFNSDRRIPMRHLTFGAAALYLLLFGGTVPAAAQTPGGMLNQGQGTSQEKFNLSPAQEHNMMQALRNEQKQTPPAAFDGHVGSKVPDSMSTKSLPDEATAQAPETKGLLFVHLPDRVLLIDPDNKAIVADHTTRGSGGSISGSDSK